MEQFNTMLKAAECAVTRCNSWSFATSDEKYDKKSLMGIAEVSDAENPADEDSFYVVSPARAFVANAAINYDTGISLFNSGVY